MGYRINKALGYGLTDIQTIQDAEDKEVFTLNDKRIDLSCLNNRKDYSDGRFLDHMDTLIANEQDESKKDDLAIEKFLFTESMHNPIGEAQVMDLENSYIAISGIHYNDYTGLPNVLVLTPPARVKASWIRHDDDIDYAEAENMDPIIKQFTEPLYPYDGWMNTETGERLNKDDLETFQKIAFVEELIQNEINPENNIERINFLKKMYKTLGVSNQEEMEESRVPMIPLSVKVLCSWTGIIGMDAIKTLRPMLYTYWS